MSQSTDDAFRERQERLALDELRAPNPLHAPMPEGAVIIRYRSTCCNAASMTDLHAPEGEPLIGVCVACERSAEFKRQT